MTRGAIGLPLRLLLTLVFAFAPIGALAATAQPGVMPAACGMMTDMGDHEGGPHKDGPKACCDAICAVAGSCAVLPTPSADIRPIVFEASVITAFRSRDRTGLSSAPEPPPPRHHVH